MNLARFTVARPVFTVMVTLIALVLGGIALKRLPIDLMPDVSFPTLTIIAEYGNTGPEEMETLVTRPLEEAIVAVTGVEEIGSESAEGQSVLRVSFVWGTNLDEATNDIRDRIDRVIDDLPEEMERPRIRKFDVTAFPIMLIGISSKLDPIDQRRLVDQQISYRLERIAGVAAVDIWGGLEREIHIDINQDKVESLGLALDEIRTRLREANVTVPGGEIQQGNMELALRTPGEYTSLDQIRNTVVSLRDGVPVYLFQVADVVDTHADQNRLIRINGEPGIRMAIRKQSGSNTVQVAEAVKQELNRLRQDFPQLNIVPVFDTSEYIRQSINNVSQSIVFGGSLAVLVLLFFLRQWRSTLIVATAIPISIISTFVLIYFGGFTLNLMTLGGLALGVGMMVDSSIVVIENITRLRHEKGRDPTSAAIDGTSRVSAAVVASTITTLVIFLPMVFSQDMAGILFRQLGYVVAFALLCSLIVSLTLIPMMAARLIPSSEAGTVARGPFARLGRLCGAILAVVEAVYLKLLDHALARPRTTLLIAVLAFAGSLSLVPFIGGEFMPSSDEGEVRVSAEMQPGTRLEVMDERTRLIEPIVLAAVPEAVSSVVSVEASTEGDAPEGEIRLSLVPRSERERSSEEIARDLDQRLQGIAGVDIRTRAGQGLFIFRRIAGGNTENLEIELRGYNLDTLDRLGQVVRDAIQDVEGISDIRLSRENQLPQQVFSIDRERAADLGLSVSRVARTIETAIAGSTAGQYREDGNEYRILVQLRDARQMDLEDVLNLTVINDQGQQVVLRNIVTSEASAAPLEIDRRDQQRKVEVNANVRGRDLNSVVADVRARLQQVPTPMDTEILIAGEYEEQQRAFRELLLNLVLATFLVYMVMACLYESLVDPLIVMGSVPLAVIGVLLMLFFTGTTFNVQSFIGCIMLIGIVVNNAILLVDHAGRLQMYRPRTVREAIRQAGRDRLRPILMTSLTTSLALVPLALGVGEGGEAQAPLARVVIGGLLSSALINLLVIPALYSLMHRPGSRQRSAAITGGSAEATG